MGEIPTLSIVIPCYNEQEIIDYTSKELLGFLDNLKSSKKINDNSFLCFVNDGSKDDTWNCLLKIKSQNKNIKLLKLSNNFGHQSALIAGLNFVKDKCDCAVTIDADLQDDHVVIEQMIEKFNAGFEIVYGVRKKRKTDTFFKRITAKFFYKIMYLLGAKIVYNHADFRLLSNRAIDFLLSFKEVNLFLRGIVPTIGLKNDIVYYDRKDRIAGETKYPLRKMLTFAFEGITSFSIKPLRIVTFLGGIILLLSIFTGIYVIFSLLKGDVVQGWTSNFVSIWFFGGIQLLSIGIIGEYLGKVYKESKRRPIFFIEETVE